MTGAADGPDSQYLLRLLFWLLRDAQNLRTWERAKEKRAECFHACLFSKIALFLYWFSVIEHRGLVTAWVVGGAPRWQLFISYISSGKRVYGRRMGAAFALLIIKLLFRVDVNYRFRVYSCSNCSSNYRQRRWQLLVNSINKRNKLQLPVVALR